MKLFSKAALCLLTMIATISACDYSSLEGRLDNLEQSIASMESIVSQVNQNITALNSLYKENILIVGKTDKTQNGTVTGYILEFSDGSKAEVTFGKEYEANAPLVRITDGKWEVSFDNGKTYESLGNANVEGNAPKFKIDAEGFWTVALGSENYERLTDEFGRPVNASSGENLVGKPLFEKVEFDKSKGVMSFTLTNGEIIECLVTDTFVVKIPVADKTVICLNETQQYTATLEDVADVILHAPEGWIATLEEGKFTVTAPASGLKGEYTVSVTATSSKGYLKKLDLIFSLNPVPFNPSTTQAWNDFQAGNSKNVLLDFSYAGYNHGETAPADINSLGYKIYDITDYGAVANDGKSDRAAFISALEDALKTKFTTAEKNTAMLQSGSVNEARAIIYFPEGEFILHSSEDNIEDTSYPEGKRTQSIVIRAGKLIIKGAGKDLTKIVMEDVIYPTSSAMYSSPDMIQIKHNSSFSSFATPATVTRTASKGSFDVEVASAAGISEGDWVCLHVKNNDADFVDAELQPYQNDPKKSNWVISKDGVEVIDYHQVKAIKGNIITFVEPIMHEVVPGKGWEIMKYPHYSEVGVEDLTFKGFAKTQFAHHASWQDDGAFKPLSMTRLTNSWIRRVGFESTSEACSIISCANVSAYQIEFKGNRGHASVRSAGSSRVFIGATVDNTSGNLVNNSNGFFPTVNERAGNYHAVGVSKHAIGTVLWRNSWGYDSCFESHATQPRATLIDCCDGGWMRWRQGGDEKQVPNHLDDLTIWNFYATNANLSNTDERGDINSNFIWWDMQSPWWKILPPVIVGFHGPAGTHFDPSQCKLVESEGAKVYPESLYEAQLKKRLGSVPAWLNTIR